MREGRLERRLADVMCAASDALRAAANALEEYREEFGRFGREEHDDRVHREGGSYRRDPEPGRDDDKSGRARDGPDDADEPGGAGAHPLPPYPPLPSYPPFPPYPPMPPIIIACGCGSGYLAGLGYGVNAGWPPLPFGAAGPAPAQPPMPPSGAQGGAVSSTVASSAPSFQPPSAEALPAGGISFAAQTSAGEPARPEALTANPEPRHERFFQARR